MNSRPRSSELSALGTGAAVVLAAELGARGGDGDGERESPLKELNERRVVEEGATCDFLSMGRLWGGHRPYPAPLTDFSSSSVAEMWLFA